jgi:hypothetical protein
MKGTIKESTDLIVRTNLLLLLERTKNSNSKDCRTLKLNLLYFLKKIHQTFVTLRCIGEPIPY